MILEIEGGSTRSHSVENSLWKRLRRCRKLDNGMSEWDTYESVLEYVLSSEI
jgi:hypothetical protein